ncbi:MAG: pantoate kinase [Candidatus Jordarchaeum sp.]|uniref:pantoate kinase n=1 Tax=Candidatus Jordarchaeum sp. TaxID=2823881 RepID=UPI004049C7D3
MVIEARAFSPGHITCFFQICDAPIDPLLKGSKGAGFSIQHGITTRVQISLANNTSVEVSVNGKSCDANVTRAVAELALDLALQKHNQKYDVKIVQEMQIPVGAGYGASGAAALSTSLALNQALNLGLTQDNSAQLAHIAEVTHKTGLGDVIAQNRGGVEIRLKPGAPGYGQIDIIPSACNFDVVCGSVGKLETKEVLSNPEKRKKINEAGDRLVKELLNEASIDNLISLSKRFTMQTGLASPTVINTIRSLEDSGFPLCSMVMLGQSVFCFVSEKDSKNACNIFRECMPDGIVFVSKIDNIGARLV